MNINKVNLILLSILSVLLCVVLIIASILIVNSILKKDYEEDIVFEEMRYLELNPRTNVTTVGFINVLEGESFEGIHYITENGNLAVISDIGMNEYICTGSCVCEEDSGRRSNNELIVRGLVCLVAVGTFVVAVTRAREYFEEECQSSLNKGGCDRNSVKPEVESCRKLNELEDDLISGESESISFENGKEMNVEEGTIFMCTGHCLFNMNLMIEKGSILEEIDCEEFSMTGEVPYDEEEQSGVGRISTMHRLFVEESLDKFCRVISKRTLKFFTSKHVREKIFQETSELCVGTNTDHSDSNGNGFTDNTSIKCVTKTMRNKL